MKIKRLTALFISLFMLLNLTGDLSVFAESNTKVYNYNGYTVYYNITNEWSNNQNITIKIENTGNNIIENWAVELDAGGEISGLWNAQIYSQTNTNYILKNSEYNHSIKSGQFVEFGYTVSSDSVKTPEKILICSEKVDITGECDVYYNILNDYGDSYQAEIVILNNTDYAIESWELVSDTTADIRNVWNAEIANKSENSCIFVSDNNTYRIEAESKISFNVSGEKGENDVVSFDNFRLYTVKITSSNNEYTYTPWLPDDMNILVACAEYEDETLFFEWTYGSNDGLFTIYENANNGKEKVAEISRGRTYEYHIGKITESREFVIETTDNGKTVISNPINIYVDDEEYVHVDYPDTDGDGIADVFEHIYSTDPNKFDTDSDGLNDYEELYLFGTDPLLADCDGDSLPDGFEVFQTGTDPLDGNSLGNDKTDGEYDMDDDGLTNYQEFIYSTNTMNADSDNDGLNDYEEIFTYKTNPSLIDTDGDNVSDGDEISLNLNPNNPQTYGYPDSEFTVVQKLDENSESLSEINNTKNNPFSISVEMDCAGKIENNLEACESGYTEIINNESIVGIVPEIIYPDDLDINEFKLTFKLDNNAVININDCHNDEDTEFDGIERFTVFKMFEDYNMLLPIETNYDASNNEVYVNTDEAGTYCLVDMELWINMLENQIKDNAEYYESIEREFFDSKSKTNESLAIYYNDKTIASSNILSSSSTVVTTTNKSKNNIGVIFLIDARRFGDTDKTCIENNIGKIQTNILDLKDKFKIKGIDFTVLSSYGEEDLTKVNNQIEITFSEENKMFNITKVLDSVQKKYANYSKTYVFLLCENKKLKYSKFSGGSLINKLLEKNIDVSIISNPNSIDNFDYGYTLVKNTGGIILKYNKADSDWNFKTDVKNHVMGEYKSGKTIILTPTNYKAVKLASEITKQDQINSLKSEYKIANIGNNGNIVQIYDRVKNEKNFADTDNDGLYDFEEIMFYWMNKTSEGETIVWNDDGTVKDFPSLEEITNKLFEHYGYIDKDKFLNQYKSKGLNEYTRILPIRSDPTSHDGDKDGITDYNERVAIEEYNEYEKYLANHSISKPRQYYKCSLNTIKKDTVETILNEIRIDENSTMLTLGDKLSVNSNSFSDSPVIIKVNNNDVYIYANVNFNFDMSLNGKRKNKDYKDIETQIKNKVINSIEEAWKGKFYGNKFDFYQGMKINVKTKLDTFSNAKSYININFKESCGRSNGSLKFLKNTLYPYINLYAFYCEDSQQTDAVACSFNKMCKHLKNGNKYCFECIKNNNTGNNKGNYLMEVDAKGKYIGLSPRFEQIVAHEFGHSLGLTDAYESGNTGKINLTYKISETVEKEEIFTCKVYYKSLEVLNSDIMASNYDSGMDVNANDIEMVLIGFATQSTQGFVNPTEDFKGYKINISPAIRTPYLILSGKNKDGTYITYLSMNAFDKKCNEIMIEPYSESNRKNYEKDIDKKISDNGYDTYYQALILS